MKRHSVILILLLSVFLLSGSAAADDKDEKKPDTKKESSKVTLNGVFEAVKSHEVKFETKQVASAKIKKLVPHGSVVKKDDFLISFDRKAYAKQLREAERKFATAELTKKESDFANEQFRQTQQLDKEAAERTWTAAQQSHAGYLEFDRQYAIDSAKFSLKQSRNSLEYQEEDLRQLERMYKEDELTEESEELVLTRARRAVESAKFYLRSAEIRAERSLQQNLPREYESRKATHERAKMAYEKAKMSLEFARKKRRLENESGGDKFKQEKEKLEEIRADSDKLVITSPANGIVFYGALKKGQISDKQSAMKPESAVSKDQVIMTIANPKKLHVRTTVSEKDFAKLKVGMHGTAKPTSADDSPVEVEIISLDRVPFAKGKYDCILAIRDEVNDLHPSMTCSITFELESDDEDHDDDDDETKKDAS